MIIGCPKEMKAGETRVALTPEWTRTLVQDGLHCGRRENRRNHCRCL